MFFSGGQCGHVGRPEELLMFKIFLVICLHVVLVTSLEENADNSSLLPPSADSLIGLVSYSNEVETTSLNDVTSTVLSTLNKTGNIKLFLNIIAVFCGLSFSVLWSWISKGYLLAHFLCLQLLICDLFYFDIEL
uniref:Adhesion G protein-coupled receptor G2 n=1 Tax=Molossus molossus TaxID=27622 RepID=A0A7J8J5D5_MOLMO|nr:adhesion G protein-coupled receptor G2 [Molossus molossus]